MLFSDRKLPLPGLVFEALSGVRSSMTCMRINLDGGVAFGPAIVGIAVKVGISAPTLLLVAGR